MKKRYWLFYIISLIIVILASLYPLYMGGKALYYSYQDVIISSVNFGRYVIPYTPICIALIICIALFPVIYKLFKRYSLLVGSALALLIFFAAELRFERIKILVLYLFESTIQYWQLSLCAVTPQVTKTLRNPIYADGNPAFKVHFYLISVIILLSVIYIIYGYTRFFKDGITSKRKPLIVQSICTAIFIGLCIFACLTAFYRTGSIMIPPISAFLTSLFFIVFGINFGVYTGCIFYKKGKFTSIIVPAVFALMTTVAMYIGELILMGGELYRFGTGFLFEALGPLILAPIDFFVILISGAATFLITYLLNKENTDTVINNEVKL